MSQPERIPELQDILSDHWFLMSHEKRMALATELGWKLTAASYPYDVLSSIEKAEFAEWYSENI